ncbi:MAG TPA: cation transporter [Acidimicrobiales bacterium]|nr:cation transporter [Acidimicrobiales bacterium]
MRRRGRRLELATTVWNAGEVVATLVLGLLAHSLALIAFGLDSLVEVFASLVVLWHLGDLGMSGRSRRAERLVAAAFGALGVYLAVAGIGGLVSHTVAAGSPAGIGFLGATVVVMVVLSRAKARVGQALASGPLLANATMTLIDGSLAAGVLLALVADLAVGWWWANPVAALAVAAVACKEGVEGWRTAG